MQTSLQKTPVFLLRIQPYHASAVLTAIRPRLKLSVSGPLHCAGSFTVALIQSVHPLLSSGQLRTIQGDGLVSCGKANLNLKLRQQNCHLN